MVDACTEFVDNKVVKVSIRRVYTCLPPRSFVSAKLPGTDGG